MKIKISITVILLTCIFESKSQNNFIIAGQHSPTDYYFGPATPDTIINIPGHTYGTGNYNIDINNDGIMDFRFNLKAPGTALGGNSYYCSLIPLNNNNLAFGYYDTCFYNSGAYCGRFPMVQAFNYNDSISQNITWINSEAYLNYSSYLFNNYSCGGSYGSNGTYIGVRIEINSIYQYGWIKIAGVVFNPYYPTTLTIASFACENYLTGINDFAKNKKIVIFPNPANNLIHIIGNNTSEITIYDLFGRIRLSSKEKEIDISSLQNGIYFVELLVSDGLLTKKIIVEH